ncbi:hypothetical protein FB451DRAFT_1052180, partial [Mycena latifolia]
FGACTAEDIEYLHSRTISRRPGHPTFNDVRFTHVSIITGLNSQKDRINELGCKKFATDTGQQLTDFYSNDTLADNGASNSRMKKDTRNKEVLRLTRAIPENRQQQLWEAPPATTDSAIPGKLSLCLGLPIMIRNNDATELCVTKGQEGRVVGWQEAIGNSGQRILDTLFIELINPAKSVQIEDLPPNVIALNKATKKVWCSLPDDTLVQISREQVLILPNFAMTDYASQGKTRDLNVVDLNNCRTHFAYYTALSRSSTSDGTVIIQGMDIGKITRGIHGTLRQEFRELETLNEITTLRYENRLPLQVNGLTRRSLLRSFQDWKGGYYEPDGLHAAVKWRAGDAPLKPPKAVIGKWELVEEDAKKVAKTRGEADSSAKKRKASSADELPKTKKNKVAKTKLAGLSWNQYDHSCAYDAVFTPLYHVWSGHTAKWSDKLSELNKYAVCLAAGYEAFNNKTGTLENARDILRRILHKEDPANFPEGAEMTDIHFLTHKMFGSSHWGTETRKCTKCGHIDYETEAFHGVQTISHNATLKSRFGSEYGVSHWLKGQQIRKANRACPQCQNGMTCFIKLDKAPPCFFLNLNTDNILFDTALHLTVNDNKHRYALRGVIYSGEDHFTSRILNPDGAVWYHDGIETAQFAEEGVVHDMTRKFLHTVVRKRVTRKAIALIYAIADD